LSGPRFSRAIGLVWDIIDYH